MLQPFEALCVPYVGLSARLTRSFLLGAIAVMRGWHQACVVVRAKGDNMRTILSAVVGVTLALSAIQGDAQTVAGEARVSLVIESKTLDLALDEWARQSGFQIFVQNWDVAKRLTAPKLRGTFTAKAALEQLLAGTPLTYKWLSERAVAIRERTQSGNDVPNVGSATWDSYFQSPDRPLRLALLEPEQFGQEDAQAARSGGTGGGPESVPPSLSIDEVIVTGTSIRGVTPAGSPLTVYTRSDITKTASGSVREFMRKVPQNFSLTDQETVQNNGNSKFADINVTRGTGINLRGLGSGSTLTLLDGQRIAPSGLEGSFVDISLVPLNAIERVEMLTDGASAIYGADAVGGVVNFILRRDFEGGETSVRYGDSSQGGGEQLTVSQLLGTSWADGNAMLVYEYQDDRGVEVADRDFIPPLQGLAPGPFALLPAQRRNSVIASLRHELTSNLDVSARGFYSRREFEEDSATFTSLAHLEGEAQASGGSLGATVDVFENWSLIAAADYSATKQQLDITRSPGGVTESELESMSSGVDLRLTGALFDIRDASARASVGINARREQFDSDTAQPGELERTVKSAYAELFVPLVTPSAQAWTHRLEVSLAARVDDYDDFGSSGVKPKFGVAWWPVTGLGLRASWSESFRAPLLSLMDRSMVTPFRWLVLRLPDPASQTGTTATIAPLVAGNPDLVPETAESFTFGVDVAPPSAPNFRASLSYYEIDYIDRVATPPLPGSNVFLLYQNAAALAPFIDRSPDPAQVASWYQEGVLNPFNVPANAVAAHYDGRYQNIAAMKTSGVELAVSNAFETGIGTFSPFIGANYITDLDARAASTTPEQQLFDRIFTPARLRVRGGLSWASASISTALSGSYINSYENNTLTPPVEIDDWITFDWHLQYDVGALNSGALLRGLTVALDIQNLTDEDPPHVGVPPTLQALDFGYDATNASAMGRFISLQISKRW
jgi:iron complex outermembrane recepter protein